MKKLTFKVSSQKEGSIVSLIKEINQISCRIYMDIEKGNISVENINDDGIDNIIELIDKCYSILSVDVDNVFEEKTEKGNCSDEVKLLDENLVEETKIEQNKTTKQEPKDLESQIENEFIVPKVEFENKYVEGLITKLLKTIAWAMLRRNISEREIGCFIYTAINEISMRYNRNSIEFSIGDIVDCNYGTHLSGEISGNHVNGIVCNINAEGMVYVVPITKIQKGITSHSYLSMGSPKDVSYKIQFYNDNIGTALLDKGKYVRPERFNMVIGKTTPEFFEKLLNQLKTTFDFTSSLYELEDIEDYDDEEFEEIEISKIFDEEECKEEEISSEVETRSDISKISEEAELISAIGTHLDKLDKSKPVEEQVEEFLKDIKMPTTENMVTQAFVIACNIQRITYSGVMLELRKICPEIENSNIKKVLKDVFKEWLKVYPELAEKCPNISFTDLLKAFAKKLRRY